MEKWEYKVIKDKMEGMFTKGVSDESIEMLNELGADGWELVEAAPVTGASQQTVSLVLYLKRRVS